MSRFEHGLRAAQRRQARFYLAGIAAFALIAVAVAAILISTNATRVRVAPADAAATGTVRVSDGLAVAFGNTVYGVSSAPAVIVSAAGFQSLRRILEPHDRGRDIEVTLAPLPGRLIAATVQGAAGTRWSIDGQQVSAGAVLDREVAAGGYAITADHPFYRSAERSVDIGRGETLEIRFDLAPVDGRLAITSEPSGAAVSVNGVAAGRTPFETALAGGVHDVALTAPGRVPINDAVRISNADPQIDRHYILKPVSATLTFTLEPPGGQLLLDGREIARPAGAHAVSAGEDHSLTYVLDGHHGASRTVTLAPGETRNVRFALEPKHGRIDIHTTPPARIIIDGTERGVGAATFLLAAVPHRVELRKAGYRTITRTVTPSDSRRLVIRETLMTETEARLAEAPREYTNQAGISLLLFQPGSFVMGAPRHQRGQRANEFERAVSLNKPFYAARHEVTNAQFARFRGGHGGAANEPVSGISWGAAAAFANWLSAAEGLTPFYRLEGGRPARIDAKSDGYRLLTEAEWEWLARRAGKRAQTVFPWGDRDIVPRRAGNIADESANGLVRTYVPDYNDGYARLAPVGSFPAETSGLFDLTGNVREWVHDWYSVVPPEAGATAFDPLGPDFGESHVVKGSSWRSGARTTLRAAFRDELSEPRDDVGFRIGRYLYGPDAPQ